MMKQFQFNLSNLTCLSLSLLLINISISCKNDIKFEKSGWTERQSEGAYPKRAKMLKDLTLNNKLNRLPYKQIIDLLGKPDGYDQVDSSSIYYDIVIDYGHDIDPVYVKTLNIHFDQDSIVKNFDINVIKH